MREISLQSLKTLFPEGILSDDATLEKYAQDASLLYVRPEIVLFPKNAEEIKKLVKWAAENKKNDGSISITARAAGTCMSGGPINDSVIIDMTRYFHGIESMSISEARVLPGTFYRDFEKETIRRGAILPSFTASKDMNTVGGMVGNNSSGEKTLLYGSTDKFVKELEMVLADGNSYKIKPLTASELEKKIKEETFEGQAYRKLKDLIEKNRDLIENKKPIVSKNSSGYNIWDVWDGKTFDLTRLMTGSQGTLGVVTDITFKLVPIQPKSKLVVIFLSTLNDLGGLVNEILETKPETIESYDDQTVRFAVRFWKDFIKQSGLWSMMKMGMSFLPEFKMVLLGGVPKLILLVEYAGQNEEEIHRRSLELVQKLKPRKLNIRVTSSEDEAKKYWDVRRESFSLLRKNVGNGLHSAPFIDDVVVLPKYLPEFLPKLNAILKQYDIVYTVAGHAGDGNFHVIPLMDLDDPKTADILFELSEKVYTLVAEYHGSIAGEHNDGLIRTPYLGKMFGNEMVALFREVKNIFDPQNIFNPRKKVGGTIEYAKAHIHHFNSNNHAS